MAVSISLNNLNCFFLYFYSGYDYAFSRIVKPYLQPDFLYKFTPYKKIQDRLRKALRTQAKQVICLIFFLCELVRNLFVVYWSLQKETSLIPN